MTASSPAKITALLLLGLTVNGQAREPSVADGLRFADPDSSGMSAERLARLDDVMQGYIDRGEAAGTVTLVARHGNVVHFDARGYRDVESAAPMRRDTIFRLASMTKPIVSVALMMLYEQGHFQLRDPISIWLPAFADMRLAVPTGGEGEEPYRTVPAERPITIQHVLTHTAGFANVFMGITRNDAIALRASVTPDETVGDMLGRLAEIPLNFEPGTEWQYSIATDVVGRLVEVMSGQTLDEFLRENIFEPLDMRDTHFYLPEAKLDRFAALYAPDENGRITLAEAPDSGSPYVDGPRIYFSGTGSPGLVSTARDYFRFHQMMLNGGELDGARILGRKTVELMTANHTGELPLWLPGPGHGFGLGYAIVTDLGQSASPRSVGSYWWGGAVGTMFWVDPREELIGILMVQIRPFPANIRDDLSSLVYQAIID